VLGPSVPPEQLPASVRIAEIAVRLHRSGVLAQDPVFADEHLDAIIVHRDDRLLEALRRQVLAPLAGLPPGVRQRLCETLTSWLRHMGDRHAIAAELHIHPQTVRYRLAQLHELFGTALDEPASRARLTLALEWGPTPDPPAASAA
jgi:DNA-binding PucR family transcriptional regulator